MDLLNRWIVPLEKRYDYLTTVAGTKIEVPFDQLLIFSTNLDPTQLADEAFLRRIKFKIEIRDPNEAQFRQIWELVCKNRRVEFDPEGDRLPDREVVPADETPVPHVPAARHPRPDDQHRQVQHGTGELQPRPHRRRLRHVLHQRPETGLRGEGPNRLMVRCPNSGEFGYERRVRESRSRIRVLRSRIRQNSGLRIWWPELWRVRLRKRVANRVAEFARIRVSINVLETKLKQQVHELGFALVGLARATAADGFDRFQEWLERGYAGEMEYLKRRPRCAGIPNRFGPVPRTVIMVGMIYSKCDLRNAALEGEGKSPLGASLVMLTALITTS